MVIKATTLFDGHTKLENIFITIEGETITELSANEKAYDFEGVVTPAFIDPHSHIGMERQGEPGEDGEVNDEIDQITPLNNPLNSIYLDDRAFKDSVDFGVLYSCIVPGSGNLLGGKSVIIRNFAKNRDEALLRDYGYKMAIGYNPRSTTSWKGTRHNTRMGAYAHLESTFDEILLKREKEKLALEEDLNDIEDKLSEGKISDEEKATREAIAKKEFELEFNMEEKALLEILDGKKICKVHVHKEDDILYLISLAKKYKLHITVEHACDVHHKEIFEKLAEENIAVVYGPLGSFDYKVELQHAYYQNAKLLIESGVSFTLMTDHPVILSHHLRDSLKYFLIQGMSEPEAISTITLKSAEILGVDDILGSVEKGKLASLIVWNMNPLHLGAMPTLVMAEGKVLRML